MRRLAVLATLLVPSLAVAGPSTPPPPAATSGAKPSAAPKAPDSGSGTAPAKPSTTSAPAPGTATPPPPTQAGAGEPAAEPTVRKDDKPVDLSDTWHYSRQRPRAPKYQPQRPTVSHAPNPTGYYSGVSLGGNHVPPFPAKQMGTRPVVLTWIGFERVGGGSRVYLEVNSEVGYEITRKGLTVRIRLANTKINVRNNARVLDLTYFETPVKTAKVSSRGRDSMVTITLKRDAEPKAELIDGKVGYKLLVLSFGGSGGAAEPDPDAPLPKTRE